MDVMGELLASQNKKYTSLFRGQQVEGEVVAMTDREITLDLGSKSEGILPTRDVQNQLKALKLGDKVKAYVAVVENESGQVVLSFAQTRDDKSKKTSKGYPLKSRGIDWSKFTAAQSQKSKLQGVVREVNKGGLIVEVEESRGFLPNSQIGLELLEKGANQQDNLIGQTITIAIIEVDQTNNKLVFSQKDQSGDSFAKLAQKYQVDQVIKGEIINVSEVGVTVKLEESIEGFLKASKMDPNTKYETGKLRSFLIDEIDQQRKRLNLAPLVTSTAGLIYK